MKCCVENCKSSWRRGKKLENISFHKFPKANYKRWLECLHMTNVEWPEYKKICSLHFSEDSFIYSELRVRLKPDAEPTLLLPTPEHSTPNGSPRKSDSTITLSSPEKLIMSDSENGSKNKSKSLKRRLLDSSFAQSSTSSGSSMRSKKVKLVQTFHNYSYSFEKRSEDIRQLKNRTAKLQSKYQNRRRTVKRLNRKVHSLHSVVNTLKNKNLISEMASEHLSKSWSMVPRQLMTRILQNGKQKYVSRSAYPPELKDFAMTLMFYSRKAYDFVRKSFNLCLPHPATIRKIYSGIECKPGFTGSSFELLKIKSEQYACSNKELICSLIVDEMAIKKQIISDGHTSYGYLNIGYDNTDDQTIPATEALVFLVVCHTEHWKLPIAYFLIKSLNSSEKASLVKEALMRLNNSNVKITSITCDGPSANFAMIKNLGCVLRNGEDDRTFFSHPSSEGEKVFAILDPCHMLKLMRNALAELQKFRDHENGLVEWKYIELLYDMEKNERFPAGTRLKKNHIEWRRQKMKVRLAAQTLSSSVADAKNF